ncbi:ATP-dependent Clp protease, ATP-binding subunit ClpX, partial [Chlamydia psittaci 84-8471/1]
YSKKSKAGKNWSQSFRYDFRKLTPRSDV